MIQTQKQRARVLARRFAQGTDRWYDLFYGITTPSERDAARPSGAPVWRGPVYEHAKHEDNAIYVSSTYLSIKSHLKKLDLGPNDVFYDIGCRFVTPWEIQGDPQTAAFGVRPLG